MDQYQLGLKRIKVAISNPPKRTADTTHSTEGEVPTAKGIVSGREDSDGFRKPSFIPPQARRAPSHAANEPDPL